MRYCFECQLPVEGSCKRHPGAKILDGGTPSRRPGRYVRHESRYGNPVVCGRTMLLAADGQIDETWQAGVDLALELGLELSQRDEETLVKHYNNVIRSEVEALASKGKVVELFTELAALGHPTEEDREREARIAKAMGVPGDLVFLRYVDPDTGVSELIQQLGRADSAEQVLELGVELEYEDILGVSRDKGNWRLDVRAPEWQLDLWRESEGGTY